MKIGNPAEKPVAAALASGHTAAPDAAKTGSSVTAAAADPSAKVELSSTAATLLTSGSNAEFDAEKVDRISKAIASGTFKVNAEVVADKLIANARELLVRVQR
ncbi:MAG: flagellar biosynthesis anti-sigma factor FlgM [Caldimonas sp.]